MSKMFRSILIANRGEIARRVASTAERLGVDTVHVYSSADSMALHTREARHALQIGTGAAASGSYLNQDAVVEAAVRAGAQAIHPGYGFLSENADFANKARLCDACNYPGPWESVES
eukprot:6212618-Pleurochrysis_carterae.AAC.4